MAKLEYSAECLCGGKILTTFKKPTVFQHTVSRVRCHGCDSEFLFSFSIDRNEKGRMYIADHVVSSMSEKLEQKVKEKKEELKQKGESA